MLGILLHPENESQPMPLIMTGPASSEAYFRQIDEFISETLGKEAQERYRIIIDNPREVAKQTRRGLEAVHAYRRTHGDAYYFNWRLKIDAEFQERFVATHDSMRSLTISEELPTHELAANLRRVFSGIVSGNVREDTATLIDEHGPFEVHGSARIMNLLDGLLSAFVEQKRMKIAGGDYVPCYRVTR